MQYLMHAYALFEAARQTPSKVCTWRAQLCYYTVPDRSVLRPTNSGIYAAALAPLAATTTATALAIT